MARKKLRIAVAGAGAFGCEHLRTLSAMEGVAIAGIADTNEGAARSAAKRFGGEEYSRDAVTMLERLRPDGLVIATPGHTHVALACAALGFHIPVLLEKPVGLSAADADVLIDAEVRSQAFVLPGHILRFSAHYRTVVGIAQSGELGLLLSVSMRNHRDETHATRYSDIDPVLMTMIHDIDLAIWTTGANAASVLAFRRPPGTTRSETMVSGIDTGGTMWHISSAWTYPTLEILPDRLEIIGERGAVEMELGRHIRVFGDKTREVDLRAEPDDDMLLAELSYFTGCIAQGRKPEVVTLDDARKGLVATDAILESLRSGGVVCP